MDTTDVIPVATASATGSATPNSPGKTLPESAPHTHESTRDRQNHAVDTRPSTMTVDLDDIDVPTFKGNFPRYKAELRIFLEVFSCQGLLDGSLMPPAEDASEDVKAAFADKERVLWQALHRGLSATELTETIEACGDLTIDALQIWKMFVARKTHTTYSEHLARLERFHSSRFERGMNVYKWIAEQIELGEMLAYGGLKISDAEMADVLLIGSRDAYPGLASSLVNFNRVGEPMPRPKLVDVMNALDRAWREDQNDNKFGTTYHRSPAGTPRAHTPRSAHTPRRQARDRLAEHERRSRREHTRQTTTL